jgi:hypothetical protein
MDSDEFEVKPAISRLFTMYEFLLDNTGGIKKFINKNVNITVVSFTADGIQTSFSVGESIGTLFNVMVNGLVQTKDVHYFHVAYTSKISFDTPPLEGSIVTITYYKGRNSVILDNTGKLLNNSTEIFTYTDSLTFTVSNGINSIVSLDINGLVEDEGRGYEITGSQEVTLTSTPVIGSKIGITYLY